MVELKLSQGAKPGHGGVLPAAKVSKEISEIRGVKMGQDCISPARHSAFATPIELMQFIASLRSLSGGKPTGFKLCIGHPWEFLAVVKAMLKTGITPDFIDRAGPHRQLHRALPLHGARRAPVRHDPSKPQGSLGGCLARELCAARRLRAGQHYARRRVRLKPGEICPFRWPRAPLLLSSIRAPRLFSRGASRGPHFHQSFEP